MERGFLIRNFAEKFYKCVKNEEDPSNLINRLKEVSSNFYLSLKERSYEDVLEDLLTGDTKKEKTVLKEWFSILLGELKDKPGSLKFSVSRIENGFKKSLTSSFALPFEEKIFGKYFYFVNEKGMEEITNEIFENCSRGKDYCRIDVFLSVKRDLIGPITLKPSLLFSYFTISFSSNLLYATAPIKGKSMAGLEILRYYSPNSKLLHAMLNLREYVKDFKYNSLDLFHLFLLSKELENCLRKERKCNKV